MMVLPLYAQEAGATLKPNYKRIAKEVRKADGPYFLDSLQERFARCDTSLTVDDLRCLYFGDTGIQLQDIYNRYMRLHSRFGHHGGVVNDEWTRYQMILTAIWSTGDGSRRRPLHVNGPDDAALIIATDVHGKMIKRTYNRMRYILLRYVAKEDGDYDVWFYIRK